MFFNQLKRLKRRKDFYLNGKEMAPYLKFLGCIVHNDRPALISKISLRNSGKMYHVKENLKNFESYLDYDENEKCMIPEMGRLRYQSFDLLIVVDTSAEPEEQI